MHTSLIFDIHRKRDLRKMSLYPLDHAILGLI